MGSDIQQVPTRWHKPRNHVKTWIFWACAICSETREDRPAQAANLTSSLACTDFSVKQYAAALRSALQAVTGSGEELGWSNIFKQIETGVRKISHCILRSSCHSSCHRTDEAIAIHMAHALKISRPQRLCVGCLRSGGVSKEPVADDLSKEAASILKFNALIKDIVKDEGVLTVAFSLLTRA